MRSSDAFLVREIVRQEILRSRDVQMVDNSRNQMERANNVKMYTAEKDDGDGFRIGGYSNNPTAG